jgi:threonine dehydratase
MQNGRLLWEYANEFPGNTLPLTENTRVNKHPHGSVFGFLLMDEMGKRHYSLLESMLKGVEKAKIATSYLHFVSELQGTRAVESYGRDCADTEIYAEQQSKEQGMIWIAPYNDIDIISGQGPFQQSSMTNCVTVKLVGCPTPTYLSFYAGGGEIWMANEVVLVTVGGGGLISGIASWFHALNPDILDIIVCQPEVSPYMSLRCERGELITVEPQETLSDRSAGGIEPGSVTFDICRELVHDFILVGESEIAEAIKFMVEKHHKIIEGAAGVALGAFLKDSDRFKGKKVAIVICGSNISVDKLQTVLNIIHNILY